MVVHFIDFFLLATPEIVSVYSSGCFLHTLQDLQKYSTKWEHEMLAPIFCIAYFFHTNNK